MCDWVLLHYVSGTTASVAENSTPIKHIYGHGILVMTCNIPYSGKLSRRKLSRIRRKWEFYREPNISGCGKPQNCVEKTFMDGCQTLKFPNVVSLKSFPLYGNSFPSPAHMHFWYHILSYYHWNWWPHPCCLQVICRLSRSNVIDNNRPPSGASGISGDGKQV